MCSMIGLLATGSMGLGWFAVIGRSRVPSPPAMTTAFNSLRLLPGFPPLGVPSHRRIHGHPACHALALWLTKLRTWVRYRAAAHQYRAVPQPAKAHPMTRATSAGVPV